MFDEKISRYRDMVDDLDTFAYTVTIPESGVLTIEETVRRLGFAPSVLEGPGQMHGTGGIALYQVSSGVITLDGINPGEDRKQLTDRLAGDGYRHWYVAFDIEGNTTLYVRYGAAEGYLQHPEPNPITFPSWAEDLGPLRSYAALLATGYDSDETEAAIDITAACLAVVEAESSVRLDEDLIDRPHLILTVSN